MSKANPRKAVAALLPAPIDVGGGVSVKPMSLAVFALLERIGSPMLSDAPAKGGTVELLPSLYILTHDVLDAFEGNLLEKALEWGDSVDVGMLGRIKEAAGRQIAAALAIVPEGPEKKKATTDGSRPSPSGRPRRSAGAGGA